MRKHIIPAAAMWTATVGFAGAAKFADPVLVVASILLCFLAIGSYFLEF